MEDQVIKEIDNPPQQLHSLNLNVPIPKELSGKVRITSVSTKTQVRYRPKENPEYFEVCEPQYKITRSWSTTVNPENDKKTDEEYVDLQRGNPIDCHKNISIKEEAEKEYIVDREKDTDKESHARVGFKPNTYKILKEEADSQKMVDYLQKRSVDPRLRSNLKRYSTISRSTVSSCLALASSSPVRGSLSSLADYLPNRKSATPKNSSLINLSCENLLPTKAMVRNAYFAQFPFEDSHVEPAVKLNDVESLRAGVHEEEEKEPKVECDNGTTNVGLSRNIIIEKNLEYVEENEPEMVHQERCMTRKMKSYESIIPQCKSSKYFTGHNKTNNEPLNDLYIFGISKRDPKRIETKLRTIIMSEVDPCTKVSSDRFNSYIDRYDLNSEIGDDFKKLTDDQITRNDPTVLKVIDVISVAQVKNVDPQHLLQRVA